MHSASLRQGFAPVQKWVKFARTKTARHKLARFLKEHAPEHLACDDQPHLVELTLGCHDRPGLADDIVAVIQQHSHRIEVSCPLHMATPHLVVLVPCISVVYQMLAYLT